MFMAEFECFRMHALINVIGLSHFLLKLDFYVKTHLFPSFMQKLLISKCEFKCEFKFNIK